MNALPTALAVLALCGALVGTLPVDIDGDGLATRAELTDDTNPVLRDTDGDGVADGRERNGETDVASADTDGDRLPDGREYDSGADPTVSDSDDDGLGDAREADLGTNPTAPDTDDDGLPDAAEVERTDVLPGADPLHKDLFIEVDYAEGCWPGFAANWTARAYATAPVDNPDGEPGITLHVVRDEELEFTETLTTAELNRARVIRFDRRQRGYRHVVVGAKGSYLLDDGTSRTGWAVDRTAVVGCTSGATLMHELGHLLGLDPSYPGVDSDAVPLDDYPSVMNYNADQVYYRYSNGTASDADVDDWSIVADHLAADVGIGRLPPVSEDGSVSYDTLPPDVAATSRPANPNDGPVPGSTGLLVVGYGLAAAGVVGAVRTGNGPVLPDRPV